MLPHYNDNRFRDAVIVFRCQFLRLRIKVEWQPDIDRSVVGYFLFGLHEYQFIKRSFSCKQENIKSLQVQENKPNKVLYIDP